MHEPEDTLIVVGYDGSPHGDAALRWAVDEADIRGARLRVVTAWELPLVDGYPFALGLPDTDALDATARRMNADSVRAATADRPGVDVEQVVVCGSPGPTLLEQSKDADLLVVGSRGLGGVRGLLLGSVSNHVVHRARCPVVVVHRGDGR